MLLFFFFNWVVGECFAGKVTFEQKSEGRVGVSPAVIWGNSISSPGKKKYKGPKAELCSACLRNKQGKTMMWRE